MKSFKGYLLHEADYRRFLKKNKNLDQDEIDSINKYFSKTNAQAGSSIDWQSKDVMNMTYDQFEEIMKNWSSGRKKTFKPIKIRGTKGKDYWEIKVKTKGFQCIIPLTQKMSQWLNSPMFACEGADYCIGWTGTAEHWEEIVVKEQQVPIYVTNGAEKWVVMIYPDNKEYDVWDRMNSMAKRKNTKIPGFDINKNLLTSSLKKLYDDIREEFFVDKKTFFIHNAEISDDAMWEEDLGTINWYSGTWKTGTWEDGIWKDGIWESGTWKDGVWRNGVWKRGTWENGFWRNGTWKNGIWENGKWENGIWENGFWHGGTFHGGEWGKGHWYGGVFSGGIWYDGKWNGGEWDGGEWLNGKWEDGKWNRGKWHNGIWYGGRWITGMWMGGEWRNGVWRGGTWYDGVWKDGTWLGGHWRGGYDGNGDYHEAGDSPDKWNL